MRISNSINTPDGVVAGARIDVCCKYRFLVSSILNATEAHQRHMIEGRRTP